MTPPWPRVERLEPERLIAEIRAATGEALKLEGRSTGGQVGAAYVRRADGHPAVMTWRPGLSAARFAAGPGAVPTVLAAAGYPAPATELLVDVPGGVVVVQSRLPGDPVERAGIDLVAGAAALTERQVGALAGHRGVPAVELYLTRSGPGYCRHEPLAEHSGRTRALLRRIEAVGAEYPARLGGDDAVHVDFQPGNFLVSGDAITGVVDWDGAGRGDRRFDLVTLRFGLHGSRPIGDALRRAEELIAGLPDDILRPAWACMALRMVDWAIRHWGPAEVEHWLDLAEQLPD